jgi:hypothetical protein
MAIKLLTYEGIWQEFLHNKHLNNDKTLLQVEEKPTYSPF